MVHYEVIFTHTTNLESEIAALNRCQDKIIAVTQHGNTYTIFYEAYGNKEEERND